ncbi:hypothetical protein ACFYQ5_26270 [Streptomyces sp. NPDC005794]|uniref:hypothetical protein n=1 Tax=Streptomyces sp. NPDC005794 TaxID=3364733 RepID=UPI0036C56910
MAVGIRAFGGSAHVFPAGLTADGESHLVADALTCVVTRPRHVAVAELLVRPTGQA